MLVRFKSTATDSINMFGDSAQQLIKMLGGSGNVPGAISAADIPAALSRLRQQLQTLAAVEASQASNGKEDDEDDKDKQPSVALSARAQPLIDLLERAGKAGEPVMWEAG
jgi:hypothetical protein